MRTASQTVPSFGALIARLPSADDIREISGEMLRLIRDPRRPRWARRSMEVSAVIAAFIAMQVMDDALGIRERLTPPSAISPAAAATLHQTVATRPHAGTPDTDTLFAVPVVMPLYQDASPGMPAIGHFAEPIPAEKSAAAEPVEPAEVTRPVQKLLTYAGPLPEAKSAGRLLAYAGVTADEATSAASRAIDEVMLHDERPVRAAAAAVRDSGVVTIARSTAGAAVGQVASAADRAVGGAASAAGGAVGGAASAAGHAGGGVGGAVSSAAGRLGL